MRAYTRRRVLASAKLGLASLALLVLVALAQGTELVPGVFLLGFGFGFAIGLAELFLLKSWLRDLPFVVHIVVKSVAIVALLYAVFALLNLLDVLLSGITWRMYLEAILSRGVLVAILESFGLIVLLLFFVHLDRLIGPGVLLGYVTGRYHRPLHEHRIFMFLDLKDSTTLAERMPGERYFEFLQRYFGEMSEPILEANADIYTYVGDEVVLSWRRETGLEEANCVRVFFLVEERIHAAREMFLDRYGVVPAFKAGVHGGEIVTAQIGELKKEVVHSGDVLNATARIQALCNSLGETLLVSGEVMSGLALGPEYSVRALGPVELRGKEQALELYAVRRASVGELSDQRGGG